MLGVGGTFGGGGDSEQRPEGVEGIIPPVEAEDEFVEISLQVLMAHPVMGPDQPGLEVGKNEVDDGKRGFGFIRIAALGDGMVVVAPFAQAREFTGSLAPSDRAPVGPSSAAFLAAAVSGV